MKWRQRGLPEPWEAKRKAGADACTEIAYLNTACTDQRHKGDTPSTFSPITEAEILARKKYFLCGAGRAVLRLQNHVIKLMIRHFVIGIRN